LEKRIPYIPLFGGLLISFFGGLTIYFQNPIFIYLKPTIINIVFAFTLFIGKVFFKKNFLKIFFKGSLKLEEIGWNKLMYRWIGFFIFLAILNEIIWRTQSQVAWVNFKVWGILSLTFVFTAFQIPLINKYKNE
jgi:intracellular septation protein